MFHYFEDRHHAGRLLAGRLKHYRRRTDGLVLGIPRGGVVLAYEIANELELPMDVCLVRKLGVPFQREFAMGAIASGGVVVLHTDLIADLGIAQASVDQEVATQTAELERRERVYRKGRPPLQVEGRVIILVDDGIATGATVEAALACLRRQFPAKIVLATAVAARSTMEGLERQADETICLYAPDNLVAVGQWYQDFTPVSDDEVLTLLSPANQPVKSSRS